MRPKMVINLVKLPNDEKIEINDELDPKKLEIEFDDFHYKSGLAIHGYLEKMAEVLVFVGTLTGTAEKVCGRCLAELTETIEEPFDFVFDIKGKTEIDITEDLRGVMIISHPFRFLCKEECRGLCAGCGVNLNTEPCKCAQNQKR